MKIKSVITVITVLTFAIVSAGCSTPSTNTSSTSSKSSSYTVSSSVSSKDSVAESISSDVSSMSLDVPNDIQAFYNKMVEKHDKYKLDFYFWSGNPNNMDDENDISIDMSDSQDINTIDADSENLDKYQLDFYKNDNNKYDKSAIMTFDAKNIIENHTIKQIISDIQLAASDKMSLSDAEKNTDRIISSYSKDSVGTPIYLPNYILYLSPMDSDNKTIDLYLTSKDEIWNKINKSDYSNITKSDYEAVNINHDKKYKLSGTIKDTNMSVGEEPFSKDIQTKTVYVTESLKIIDNSGNEYTVAYSYLNSPVLFKKGKKCTVYGTLSGKNNAYIHADSIELNK